MFKEKLIEFVKELALEVRKPGEPPFQLKNGGESNFYLDCRRLTLHSAGLRIAISAIGELLYQRDSYYLDTFDAVGGPSIGADSMVGAILQQIPSYQAVYRGFLVRAAAKDHGKAGRIIGSVRPGDRCLFVEDVVTTGGSLLEAVDLLRDFGAVPKVAVALIDRGCDPSEFARRGVEFHAVLTLKDLGLEP